MSHEGLWVNRCGMFLTFSLQHLEIDCDIALLRAGAGILISWEPKTLTNNLWSTETQSSPTKRCWTTAKVQHEKLIATVNQLKKKVALWHWPRELLIWEWTFEMICREKHNIVFLFFLSKTHKSCLQTLLLWATSRCNGDHIVHRCECESGRLCVCLHVAPFDKLATCPGCDSEPETAAEAPLLLSLAFTFSFQQLGRH